jgi:hypothetical protein
VFSLSHDEVSVVAQNGYHKWLSSRALHHAHWCTVLIHDWMIMTFLKHHTKFMIYISNLVCSCGLPAEKRKCSSRYC